MEDHKVPQALGHATPKDSIACYVVFAAILGTAISGLFVPDIGSESSSSPLAIEARDA